MCNGSGVVWYDVIWYVRIVWYGMICGMDSVVWYDVIWYSVVWYDVIWYTVVWYDVICTIYNMSGRVVSDIQTRAEK